MFVFLLFARSCLCSRRSPFSSSLSLVCLPAQLGLPSSSPSVAISRSSSWPRCGIRRPPLRASVFILCADPGGMRRPKKRLLNLSFLFPPLPPPLPSSFFSLSSFCFLVFCFSFLPFFLFSFPRAGCGALNTHLVPLCLPFPFLSFSLSLFLSFSLSLFLSFSLSLFLSFSLSLSLSLSLSFFLSFSLPFFRFPPPPLFQLLPVVPLRPFRDGLVLFSVFNFAVVVVFQV